MIHVWDSQFSEDDPSCTKYSFAKNDRCTCLYRNSFLFQCAHEYAVDKEFIVTKYSTRWYNRRSYNSLVISDDLTQSIDESAIETNDQFDF